MNTTERRGPGLARELAVTHDKTRDHYHHYGIIHAGFAQIRYRCRVMCANTLQLIWTAYTYTHTHASSPL